jgi:FkbM family methyltransferase
MMPAVTQDRAAPPSASGDAVTRVSGAPPDAELRAILAVTRRLPRWRLARFVARNLRKLYLRRPRGLVDCELLGVRMFLDPEDYVDSALLFHPEFYEREELAYVRGHLAEGDTFVDLGSHVGAYAVVAAAAVGEKGRVIAVEADRPSYERLVANARRNGFAWIECLHCGVSDAEGVLPLTVNRSGNRGAATFLIPGKETVDVACHPLLDLLRRCDVERVRGMKLDIEGFEHRVLQRFLADADPRLWPEFVVIEQKQWWTEEAGGNAVELLQRHGYRIVWHGDGRWHRWTDYILERGG